MGYDATLIDGKEKEWKNAYISFENNYREYERERMNGYKIYFDIIDNKIENEIKR